MCSQKGGHGEIAVQWVGDNHRTIVQSSPLDLKCFSDCRANEQSQQLTVSPKCMLLWPTLDK